MLAANIARPMTGQVERVAGEEVVAALAAALALAAQETRRDAEAHDGEQVDGDDGPVQVRPSGVFMGWILLEELDVRDGRAVGGLEDVQPELLRRHRLANFCWNHPPSSVPVKIVFHCRRRRDTGTRTSARVRHIGFLDAHALDRQRSCRGRRRSRPVSVPESVAQRVSGSLSKACCGPYSLDLLPDRRSRRWPLTVGTQRQQRAGPSPSRRVRSRTMVSTGSTLGGSGRSRVSLPSACRNFHRRRRPSSDGLRSPSAGGPAA